MRRYSLLLLLLHIPGIHTCTIQQCVRSGWCSHVPQAPGTWYLQKIIGELRTMTLAGGRRRDDRGVGSARPWKRHNSAEQALPPITACGAALTCLSCAVSFRRSPEQADRGGNVVNKMQIADFRIENSMHKGKTDTSDTCAHFLSS